MLNRTIAKFLFYAVALVLLVWTSSLTYSFLSMALPGTFWLVPLLGLVVFDVGMIAWLFVFLSHAEGAIQRAAAIILCLFNFVGVGLMTISEILLDGQTMVEAPAMLGTVAIWAIGIWTTVNVLGVLVFHLGDNKARREMALQSEKDAIFDAALDDLKTRRIAAQKALSQEMSAVMMDELTASLRADNDRNGIPDLLERGRQSGPRITHDDVAAYLAANPELMRLALPVSQNTQTTAHHDTSAAPPSAGQGQRPNGPPAPTIGRRSPDGAPDF